MIDDQATQVAATINAASADPVPEMPTNEMPDQVPLLRGLYVVDQERWLDTAVVRELNGEDEEFMARIGNRADTSYIEYTSALLQRGVEMIGDMPANKHLIDSLILADRDLLFLALVRRTYGDEKEILANCRSCGHRNEIILELEKDFPVKGMDQRDALREPITVELKDGEVQLRYPTGDIVNKAIKDSDSVPGLNTHIIAQCVITAEELPLSERLKWTRKLSIPDRKKLDRAITEATDDLGPQLGEVETRCTECDQELPIVLDWVSLLLG